MKISDIVCACLRVCVCVSQKVRFHISVKLSLERYFKTSAFICNQQVKKKGKRKVQGVPQSQTAALPRPQEEEEADKSKQAQTEETYEKH